MKKDSQNTWEIFENIDLDQQSEETSVDTLMGLVIFMGLTLVGLTAFALFSQDWKPSYWWVYVAYIPTILILSILVRKEYNVAKKQDEVQKNVRDVIGAELMERYQIRDEYAKVWDVRHLYAMLCGESEYLAQVKVQLQDYTQHEYGMVFNEDRELQLVNLDTQAPDAETLRSPENPALAPEFS